MSDGNPHRISDTITIPPWQGVELSKRIAGGTLYVDAYTDIEAPRSVPRVSSTGGTYALTFPTVNVGGRFLNRGGNISLPAVLDDVRGTAACTGCSYVYTTGQLQMTDGILTFSPSDGSAARTLTPATRTVTGSSLVADTDYLAGGVWLIVPDNRSSGADYEFGAFGDGSDPFLQSNLTGLTGRAIYDGDATGIYSETAGGSPEIGYFDADVRLTADFGNANALGTISGSITGFEVDNEPITGTLNLGSASIGTADSGFFRGPVTGSSDGRQYTGSWGGAFFGNDEADGRPGSVGGTFGGHSTDDAATFVGVFGAYKQ